MIKKRRLDLNLKQSEAAELIGCDKLTVANWETGRSSPRIIHMSGVVRFLGFNPLPTGSTIGEQLVACRKSRGLTQKDFARELGVDPSTLARWERGERKPAGRFERIVAVALADLRLSLIHPVSGTTGGSAAL
jgi:transcriptional regulator with XRE-family HTH domain